MTRFHAMNTQAGRGLQQGVATLVVTLLLLVIISLIVLFSTNVAFFEQRTATNDNRARLAEQAAEFAGNLAGEYLKANRDLLIANTTGGWLATGSTRWVSCASVTSMPATHPCMAEVDATRRAQLYFYTTTGTVSGSQLVPYRSMIPDAIELETTGVGGTAAYATTTEVRVLLCRIDSSLATPACALTPVAGNRIALTVLSDASIPGENATAQLRQTWATYTTSSPSAAVPLIASGLVKGVGNAQIVQSPNAVSVTGGSGFPASIWSPCQVDIEASPPAVTPSGCEAPGAGASVGSLNTCTLGDYLRQNDGNPSNDVLEANLLTTCAGAGTDCGCSTFTIDDTDRSGHSGGGTKQEGSDVLDRDSNHGPYRDIAFFPDAKYGIDKAADLTDDSLFEWIFGVDYEASNTDNADGLGTSKGFTLKNCSVDASFDSTRSTNCAVAALDDLGALSIASCGDLSSASTGIYYVRGGCNLPTQVGSPTNTAIVVVNSENVEVKFNNTIFYGMLFVRSDNDTALLKGAGNSKIFGSLVVQGKVDIGGGIDIVYRDTAATSNPNVIPQSAKFGLVPGSWLDNRSGF